MEGIFVLEEYKKRGYAKELLGACQNWTKDQWCFEFASDCELDNEDSLINKIIEFLLVAKKNTYAAANWSYVKI